MAEVSLPTIVEGGNNGGWGNGTGAGFIGGLIIGSMWGGNGWGGWGNNGRGAAVADATLANAVEHVSDQVTQGTISALQQTQNSNMFMGNLINSTGDAITGAINQGTITGLQSNANLSEKLCNINNNITSQGYESRIMSQQLAAQGAQQAAALSALVASENCANRELMRDIQAQAVRDKLSEAQAKIAALETQITTTNIINSQTNYLLSRLLPTGATNTTGTGGA